MLLEDLGVRCPDTADSEGHGACGRVTEHVPTFPANQNFPRLDFSRHEEAEPERNVSLYAN